tara:strand:+ start:340 stop:1599 length:1260 start_codon:yes stop_codon:yes gene_type:complete
MGKTFFSIVIPVFNTEKFIKKCVQSVLNQNFNDLEIILINDYSKDKSGKICKELSIKNPNKLKFVQNKKNLGVSTSRNIGLNIANGKYIIFLDSDDYLIKNSLNYLYKKIKLKNYPEVIFNHIVQKKEPKTNLNILKYFGEKKLFKKQFLSKTIKKNFILNECWRIVVSKDLIIRNKINFKNIKIAEDVSFVFKILTHMSSIIINKNKFLFHRSRADSLKYTKGVDAALAYYSVYLEIQDYKKRIRNQKEILNYLDILKENIKSNMKIYFSILNKSQISQLIIKMRKFFPNKKNPKLEYKKFILNTIEQTERKIKNSLYQLRVSQKKINIYCAGIMSEVLIKILMKNGFQVKNIIDDDPIWVGKKIMNINVKKISIFNKSHYKNDLIIICNHSEKVINNIKTKLKKLKINNKQISSFSF